MKNQTTLSAATYSPLRNPARAAHAFLLLVGLCLLPAAPGWGQTIDWATKAANSYVKSAVSADKFGNTYVLATFSGNISLGPYIFTSKGGNDVCLVKYNASGTVQWARRIGSPGDEMSGDVAVSADGAYVFITGSFESTVTFSSYHGYELSPLTSAGSSDAFIARYSTATGTVDWSRKAGGASSDDGYGIFADGSGNVYVTGSFSGTALFTSGANPVWFTSNGHSDIFLTKYSLSGTHQFSRRLGGTGFDYGRAVAVDKNNGDIYLTGGYSTIINLYVTNAITAKYNAAGVLQWNKLAGTGATIDIGNDIIVTGNGAYVTGYFGDKITFGNTTLSSIGSSDAFLVLYAPNGNAVWAKRYGGGSWDEGQSIAEHAGALYISGSFKGSATFGHNTFTAKGGAGDQDLFITRLFADGTPSWTQRIGSNSYDYGRGGLAVPSYNSVYFTGHYGTSMMLGGQFLSGSGILFTKVIPPTLPSVADFRLINANTDADLGAIPGFSEINYTLIGTDKINIKVNTDPGTVGSVKLDLDGVTKTENASPYTWAGDAPKNGGGTNYLSFTPPVGGHQLRATAYSGPNGTGARGVTKILYFTVVNQPVVSGLTLINAATDAAVGLLVNAQTINYSNLGTDKINIRANTNPGTVGSVKFVLDGVTKVENAAPYAYAGDAPKSGGGTNYLSFTPGAGFHQLKVTPYAGSNGTGTAGKPYEIYFYVQAGSGRVAAETEPEAAANRLTAAPNPFSDRTMLGFTSQEAGPARLELYAPNGTLLRQLYEGTVEAGQRYTVELDAAGLPSGVYVGRLTTGKRVTHQKLVLTK